METEELCSISISPLVTDSFAIQWSPDNQISLITDKGVHIFVSYYINLHVSKIITFGIY